MIGRIGRRLLLPISVSAPVYPTAAAPVNAALASVVEPEDQDVGHRPAPISLVDRQRPLRLRSAGKPVALGYGAPLTTGRADRPTLTLLQHADPTTVAHTLDSLRSAPLVQYGLRQALGAHRAELALAIAGLAAYVLAKHRYGIAEGLGELIHILTPIAEFLLSLVVGPHVAELIIAIAGFGLLWLLRHRGQQAPVLGQA